MLYVVWLLFGLISFVATYGALKTGNFYSFMLLAVIAIISLYKSLPK